MRRVRIHGRSPLVLSSRALLLSCLPLFAFALSTAQTPTHATKTAATAGAESSRVRAQKLYYQTEATFILNHNVEKGQAGFLSVVQIDPRNAPAWFNLGVLAESSKSWLKAESYFQRYLQIAPNGPDAKRARAQLALLPKYVARKVMPEAFNEAEYDAAVQRARIFLAAGHFREAIAEAGHAKSLDADRWEAYAVVSLCMAKQNKRKEAAQFEALAVEHSPESKRDQVRAALSKQNSNAH